MSITSGLRPSVLKARQRLAEGRQKLKQRHEQKSPGLHICRAQADLMDAVVLDLFQAALIDLDEAGEEGIGAELALVAHAGYGRRDVAPYSDVDLMILHDSRDAARVAPVANRLVRDVFDAGLVLGQSVRTIDDACDLAMEDAQIFTSLVESRHLGGSQPLFDRFLQRFTQLAQRRQTSLISAIEKAREEERTQFGDTVYLLEPNIKRSRGGLRDIQLSRWIGFVRYGAADADSLQLKGVITREDQRLLRQATDFLLQLRNEMHFHAGKSNDVLDRAEQVRLAALLDYAGQDGQLPVEQFMQEYFRLTSAVSRVVTRFVAGAYPGSKLSEALGVLFSHQVERDFRVGPSQIAPTRRGAVKLQQSLEEILRLADLANLYNKRIARSACELIRQAVPHLPDEVNEAAAARFLSILSHKLQLGGILRTLYDLGVLELVIPAFTHARCLLQFNEYHKFTVDEHSLLAVERATQFAQDLGALGNVYRHIKQKHVLHLALLIHDLGKGFAEDHSEVGLRIAEAVATRLFLPRREREVLKFLVHKHLLMSHLAFRRDTSDEQLIIRFAVEVGSPDILEMLFVLTAADLAAVGPGVLNSWKIEVLSDLFERTMDHLAGDRASMAPEERWRTKRDEILQCLKDDADQRWVSEQIQTLPPAYLHAKTPQQIAEDLHELHKLRSGDVIARGRYLPETGTVEYTVYTFEDIAPGVFHKLTGALSSKGLQILSAEINTLAHELVLDRFYVSDPDFAGAPPTERLENVSEELVDALCQGNPPSFRRIWRISQPATAAALAPLPTVVRADNSTSERFTVLDIFAADRLGLLYAITRKLFELGLNVGVAKIGTYLDQVVDVFYVTDQQGRKIVNDERILEIRAALLEAIEANQRQEQGAGV